MSVLLFVVVAILAYQAAKRGLVLLSLVLFVPLVGLGFENNPWAWFLTYGILAWCLSRWIPEPDERAPDLTVADAEPDETPPQKPKKPRTRPKSRAHLKVVK